MYNQLWDMQVGENWVSCSLSSVHSVLCIFVCEYFLYHVLLTDELQRKPDISTHWQTPQRQSLYSTERALIYYMHDLSCLYIYAPKLSVKLYIFKFVLNPKILEVGLHAQIEGLYYNTINFESFEIYHLIANFSALYFLNLTRCSLHINLQFIASLTAYCTAYAVSRFCSLPEKTRINFNYLLLNDKQNLHFFLTFFVNYCILLHILSCVSMH